MKTRRHHNNTGYRQIKRGGTYAQVKRVAQKLGVPPSTSREIYCCGCSMIVIARLTSGTEIYPHRPDLSDLPFWKCDACKNYVGCHHKTVSRTRPLGNIPTPELMKARGHIHRILDPLWRSGRFSRGVVYSKLSTALGYHYHTGDIKTLEEARRIYKLVKELYR